MPAATAGAMHTGAIRLAVNDAVKQASDIGQMIWSVPDAIAYLSQYEALQPGDLIMTGTPEGVGAVKPGDRMHGHIDGLPDIVVRVAG